MIYYKIYYCQCITNNYALTTALVMNNNYYSIFKPRHIVRCLKPTNGLEIFDDLCLAAFNSNSLKMDFEKILCTSANARKHIQMAYYQQQLWIQAPLEDGLEMVSQRKFNSSWFVTSKPEDLPDPCTCGKCVHKNGYVTVG